jgi:hypothetical protein
MVCVADNEFDNCTAGPTTIYERLQVIGFEGSFWFEVFLLKMDFQNVALSSN